MRRYLSLSTEPNDNETKTETNDNESSGRISYIPSTPGIPSVRRHLFSSEESQTNNPMEHLSKLVEEKLGNIENPIEAYSNRVSVDPLLKGFYSTHEERKRLLEQFLRARHNNPKESFLMMINAFKWRKSMTIERYLSPPLRDVLVPDSCFPMCIISTPTTCKQPVIYGLIRLLDKKRLDRALFQRALFSFLEQSYFAHTYALDEMIVILDFHDWSLLKHSPYRIVKEGIQTLQDYYPERLGRVFLLNYPTSIRAAYTAISPIIDAGAKAKIVWIPDSDPSSVLKRYAPPKSIPTFLGGQLHADFPTSWPDIAAEFQSRSSA